jgi:hypothetical protein
MPEDMTVMDGVREYTEHYAVKLDRIGSSWRLVIRAFNEGGMNCTSVDLLDVLKWVKANRPDLWEAV